MPLHLFSTESTNIPTATIQIKRHHPKKKIILLVPDSGGIFCSYIALDYNLRSGEMTKVIFVQLWEESPVFQQGVVGY